MRDQELSHKWDIYSILTTTKANRTLQKIRWKECKNRKMGRRGYEMLSAGHIMATAFTISQQLWLPAEASQNSGIGEKDYLQFQPYQGATGSW